MILPKGEVDAKEKNPDVRSGFDITFTLYAVPLLQSVGRDYTAPPQEHAGQKLSKIEKQRGDDRDNPDIPPGDLYIGHQHDHEFVQRGKNRTDSQGVQQKESNAHDESEGEESILDKIPRTAFSLALCISTAAVLVLGIAPRSVLAFAEQSILSLLM